MAKPTSWAETTKDQMTWDEWFALLDRAVSRKFGLGFDDFPALVFVRDWYEDGKNVRDAFRDWHDAQAVDGSL